MKKIITFLLLILFFSPAISFAAQQDSSIEEIILNSQGETHDRGPLIELFAYLLCSLNSIYIMLPSSLGVVTITILDSSDNMVYYAEENTAVVNDTMFSAPNASGSYSLQIHSSAYTCIGHFIII